jgi:hypothetical protein
MTKHEFLDALESYCIVAEGSVTSYGRTAARNTTVKGVTLSSHRFWRGADVVYEGNPPGQGPPEDLAKEVARRVGLKLIREGDHDHLQPLDWPSG